jgi:Rrf2 family protein
MFRFSKKIDYALLALQYLASPGEPGDLSARAIAARFEIPLELLSKILQRLARCGLIVAHKGVHGGYRLARSPDDISIADVGQAVDGFTTCSPAPRFDELVACPLRDPPSRVTERIVALLRALTVADISTSPEHRSAPVTRRKQPAAAPAAGRAR